SRSGAITPSAKEIDCLPRSCSRQLSKKRFTSKLGACAATAYPGYWVRSNCCKSTRSCARSEAFTEEENESVGAVRIWRVRGLPGSRHHSPPRACPGER